MRNPKANLWRQLLSKDAPPIPPLPAPGTDNRAEIDLSPYTEDKADPPTSGLGLGSERAPVRKLIEEIRSQSLCIAFEGARTRQIVLLARQNAETQEAMTNDIFGSSKESSETLADLARRAERLSASNRKAVDFAQETGTSLDAASERLELASRDIANLRETVAQLSDAAANIARISNTVRDFSKQTNLLALNASIEAARAGESGASFSVVAEEVRALANKVARSNEQIRDTLSQVDGLVRSAESGSQEIETQTAETHRALCDATDQFKQLLVDSRANCVEIEQVGSAMEELTHTNQEVFERAGEIKSLSHRLKREAVQSDAFSQNLRNSAEAALVHLCRVRTGTGPLEALLERRAASRDRLQRLLVRLDAEGADLFDRDYVKVAETDPQKFRVSYLDAARDALQDAIDESLDDCEGASYSTLVDANGYLPVHHRWLSHPPTGERATDLLHSRHMRLFNAPGVELERARNTRPFLIQMNLRDTGEVLGDLALPVYVRGQHWGNLILGFPVEPLLEKSA